MVITKEYKEGITETIEIIKHMEDEEIEKIPLNFIKRLNELKDENYIPRIDFTKPIEENNLKSSTKAMLALIYRDYICSEEEKEVFQKELEKNEQEKYKINFNKNSSIKIDNEEKILPPATIKKNIFQKLIDWIFKRK